MKRHAWKPHSGVYIKSQSQFFFTSKRPQFENLLTEGCWRLEQRKLNALGARIELLNEEAQEHFIFAYEKSNLINHAIYFKASIW